MKIQRYNCGIALVLAVAAVAAVAGAKDEAKVAAKLDNTQWVLALPVWEAKSMAGDAVKVPTLGFSGDRLSASAGCNGMGATYTASGDGTFSIDGLMQTQMSCGAELDAQEKKYGEALNAATKWQLSKSGKVLMLQGAKETLVFERAAK